MDETFPDYYDRDGKPLELFEWAKLTGDPDYKRVASTQVGEHWVSTVWLGLNHNYFGEGPPLIFETMIFGRGDNDDTWRYPTLEAAQAGHERIVAWLKECERLPANKQPPPPT